MRARVPGGGAMRQRCVHCGGAGFVEVTAGVTRVERIIAEAASDWGITQAEFVGPSRRKECVGARRDAAQEMRKLGMAWKEIGHHLGGRDHSTIINLLNGKQR